MKKIILLGFIFISLTCFSQYRLENVQSITSGASTTLNDDVKIVKVNPGSILVTHTITLPANPYDRQEITIFFGGTLTSGTVVTTLTIAANTGHGLIQVSAITTAVFGDCLIYFFDKTDNKWYRKK